MSSRSLNKIVTLKAKSPDIYAMGSTVFCDPLKNGFFSGELKGRPVDLRNLKNIKGGI